MPRLLDSNVFITAKNTYYAFEIVPAFWTWLVAQAQAGEIASTDLVYEELKDGNDDLAQWVKDHHDLIFKLESTSAAVAAHVATLGVWAQADGYRQHVVEAFMDCADPFLVGVAADLGYTVVTHETPAGARRKKVKIPDVCTCVGVPYEDTFQMLKNLGARFD